MACFVSVASLNLSHAGTSSSNPLVNCNVIVSKGPSMRKMKLTAWNGYIACLRIEILEEKQQDPERFYLLSARAMNSSHGFTYYTISIIEDIITDVEHLDSTNNHSSRMLSSVIIPIASKVDLQLHGKGSFSYPWSSN